MRKFILTLLLAIPLFLSAQNFSEAVKSDSVVRFSNVDTEIDTIVSKTDFYFFKKKDSSFVRVVDDKFNIVLYLAPPDDLMYISHYVIHRFNAVDSLGGISYFGVQWDLDSHRMVYIGMMDKDGNLYVFIINKLREFQISPTS